MPRIPKFQWFLDERKTISIKKLSEWGYLERLTQIGADITWRRNGAIESSISILVTIDTYNPNIELIYTTNDEPRKYKIRLIRFPSNLGKGYYWYFECPITKKRCRKLYSINGYFYHRTAFTGQLYSKQSYSKNNRDLYRQYELHYGVDNLYKKLYKKNFKRFYKGQPTKRFLTLSRQIEIGENTPEPLG